MATAWFITVYKQATPSPRYLYPARYCAIDDYSDEINALGGFWSDTEVLGNYALVKVRASAAGLTQLANRPNFFRLPVDRLDDSLGSLSQQTLLNIRDRIVSMGYTLEEIQAALPADWRSITLRQLLRFVASRRRKPRYDVQQGMFFLDGEVQVCKSVEAVDAEVSE